jgi:probable rRNA maturation factor
MRSSSRSSRRTKLTVDHPGRSRIAVTLSDGRGGRAAAPGLARWLARVAPSAAPRDVAIALVSDARIRALNRRFRRTDKTTDVLSFEPSDIVIATGVARRQAREAGHPYGDELKVLALHGLLHLMGYDHHDSSDAGRMARLETRLRRKGGLKAGLIERAQAPAAGAKK